MSFPAGSSTPRGPFDGAAPLAHRPLSAIAATIGGGVPQSRIKRVLAELLAPLSSIHERGRICADISTHSVGLDENGRAHLLAAQAQPRQHDGQLPAPTPGFAPFEFYAQTPDWPRGPWSDIYSLCAMAHSLVTGSVPPPAPERVVNDTYVPLAERELPRYDREFLAAIDAGLAVRPADRPQSIEALAALLAFAPVQDDTELATIAPISVSVDAPRAEQVQPQQPRPSVGAVLFVLLLIAIAAGVGFYWWNRLAAVPKGVITASESMVPPIGSASQQAGPAASPPALPPEPPPLGGLPAATTPANGAAAKPETRSAATPPATGNGSGTTNPAGTAAAPGAPTAGDTGERPQTGTGPNAAPAETPGETAAPANEPAPARVLVRINVMPWGEIWINGAKRGISPPLKELRLLPGKYSVTVRNAELPPYQTTIEVKPGRTTTITHTFR